MTEGPITAIAQKIAGVVRVTQVLDRNRSDSVFEQTPTNEIIYVFDTNVVQMFLEPYLNPRFAELFFTPEFGGKFSRVIAFNTQTCLLASEFLFSGNLPGQRGQGTWYMSPEHHRETLEQLEFFKEKIARSLHEPVQGTDSKHGIGEFLASIEYLLNLDAEKDPGGFHRLALTEEIAPSLNTGAREDTPKNSEVVRNIALCHALANERLIEPIQQYKRFMANAGAKVRNLQSRFQLPRELKDELTRDVDWWQIELQSEIRDVSNRYRSQEAIRADAATLAQINFISRHLLKENERIVFVTGDRTLFRLYRRWFTENQSQVSFALRPISHYTPILNLRDAESQIATEAQKNSFALLQSAVEAVLSAMNLAFLADRDSPGAELVDYSRSRARDFFVSRMEEDPEAGHEILTRLFPKFADEEWLKGQSNALDEAIRQMQEAERLTTGAFPQFISNRLDEDKKMLLRLAQSPEGNIAGFKSALQERLGQAISQGFRFSAPMMPLRIAELLSEIEKREREGQGVTRVEVRVGLNFPMPSGKQLSQDRLIEQLSSSSPESILDVTRGLLEAPDLLFALTALLAFRLELWVDAARAAEFAAEASVFSEGESSEYRQTEYHYLRAVAQRFRLANTGNDDERDHKRVWDESFRQAKSVLKTAIDIHIEREEFEERIRNSAELAALNLSFAEWFAYTASAEEILDEDVRSVREALDEAVNGLIRCAEELAPYSLDEVRAEPGRSRRRSAMLLSAKKQTTVNIWAAVLCVWALEEKGIEWGSASLHALSGRNLWDRFPYQKPSQVSQAYFSAVNRDAAELAKVDVSRVSLALDQVVIRYWRSRLSNDRSAESQRSHKPRQS